MDLTSTEPNDTLALLMTEALEHFVESHGHHLDKRAAQQKTSAPTLSISPDGFRFLFVFEANRQEKVAAELFLGMNRDEEEDDDEDRFFGPSFVADCECTCDLGTIGAACHHSLAAAWWLQEQLRRRTTTDAMEFLSSLKMDAVAAGREIVNQLLVISGEATAEAKATQLGENTRLTWRISASSSRYYSPISIVAYEQRPRKNGKGWTKGREMRSYDLLRRDFTDLPIDSRVAALVSNPSYSFDGEHFNEFAALRLLVGHPNVVWAEHDTVEADVVSSELTLSLEPIEATDESSEAPSNSDDALIEETKVRTKYRPKLGVAGLNVNPLECEMIFGYASPAEPIVILFDERRIRIVVCELRNPRAARLIQFLITAGLNDVVLDHPTASQLVMGSNLVDSLVQVRLPDALAGPIEDVTSELIIELRPRPGAGLYIALAMHDERFNRTIAPGDAPEVVTCLTPNGPVRLRRNLTEESASAESVAERFAFCFLKREDRYRYVAETDDVALDLLGRLYAAGDSAPRLTWPEGETIRIRSEITPSALRVRIDDRKDWFGLSGSIELDGREIPLADLLLAVREKRALVQVGDREFARISDVFRKRLQQLGDAVVAERGSLRVADATVPVVQELIGDDVTLEASARWHDSIRRLESLAKWNPDKPKALDADLRDYQLEGFQWLSRLSHWGVGGVLADDMGLGKTVQALAVLVDRASEGPALIVAPTSVGDNWMRETLRFTPSLRPHLYRDSDRDQLIQNATPGDLIIVSYQLLQRDVERFAARPWHTLVLDEAQFIKNSQTKTSQAIRRLDADWRVGLSGTPLENHLGELWSLFRTLSPGMLGSWERFRTRFADPIERHHDDERRQSLATLVRPFILRRTKNAVLKELPPRTEVNLQAQLSTAERKLYEDARLSAVAELSGLASEDSGGGDQRIKTLAWLTKLRQLACHPRLVDAGWRKSSAKLDLLMELVQELSEGDHRALVFSQFVKHLSVVRQALDAAGITYQYLDGATPAKERQRRVDAFQNGEGELFLISLKAGGTGLNLTAADYVIHLDPWWNPAVEDQATDRAHRIGQERPVTVYRLVAQGTIEEQILQLHADKRELVSGVLDGTDTAGKMGTKELIELIKQGVVEA